MYAKTGAIRQTTDFGCPDEASPHHFVVTIPARRTAQVTIAEHYGLQACAGYEIVERCILSRSVWATLAEVSEGETS